MSNQDPPSLRTTPISGSEPIDHAAGPDVPAVDESKAAADQELAALRRSFPTPKRREEETDQSSEGIDWRSAGTWILVGTAVVMAGAAAWKLLSPPAERAKPATAATAPVLPPAPAATGTATPAPAAETPPPPDDAAALYLSENSAAVSPAPDAPPMEDNPFAPPDAAAEDPAAPPPPETAAAAENPPADPAAPADPAMAETPAAPVTEDPFNITPTDPAAEPAPAAPVELGPLEEKYLAALLRASAGVTAGDSTAWTAEIERVKQGRPLPESVDALPADLQRLLSIYRKEKEKAASTPATANPDAREIELFIMGDDSVTLLVNGEPVKTAYVTGSSETPGSVQKATLTLRPGDVLGFDCRNTEGWRYFAATARAGVQWLFSSSDRWDAAVDPPADWWKGEGKGTARISLLRGRTDYSVSTAAQFEKAADSHSSEYRVLWAGNENRCSFRYRIRPVDLPKKK